MASAADGPEHMPFGTSKGPTFLGSFWRVTSAARTMARVEGPPEPMTMPVRSLTTSPGSEPGVANGLVHGDVVPADAGLHEAARLARDHRLPLEVDGAVHLAAKSELGVFVRAHDAGLGLPQRGQHLLGVVPDRGDDPHAGHDHASHATTSLRIVVPHLALDARTRARVDRASHAAAGCSPASNNPTRRSVAW